MSRKKKQGMPYDEYYNNGVFEIGRVGSLVETKTHMTVEDVNKRNVELAKQYEEKKHEIDNQVKAIIEDIKKCCPLNLLLEATDRAMLSIMNVVSEIQIEGKHNFEMRTIEYLQSILVSTKLDEAKEENQEEIVYRVLDKIDNLFMSTVAFYFYWAAKKTVEDNELSDSDIQYIVEAQLMGNVRGKRYQFQQLTNIENLISPHSEKMKEIYGISAEELMNGLRKLEHSLSSGKLDSMKELYSEFLQFQEEAKGKSFDEVEVLLNHISESKQSIENSAKCFGTDLYNVKKVTGWSDMLVDSLSWKLGECEDYLRKGDFAGWPIIDLPVQKKPFIEIEGISYCFDYYNLFDNIYRIIQKDIRRHDEQYTTMWAELQQVASETLVENLFKKLLPGCQSYVGNYYPVGKSLKMMDENDVLILYDDTLIIAEVKAGSFTYTPAITDYEAHKKSFNTLVGKADYQCERTLNYIKSSQQIIFYEDEKSKKPKFVVDGRQYRNIYTFCVTVDNFNVFETKIEKTNFFNVSSGTIAISIDDLEIYAEYFTSPLYFLHYLKHRKLATSIKSLMLSDELDHLGMYIVHNTYESYAGECECDSFFANGYREKLDAYFAGLYCEELHYEKPVQDIPNIIKEIITCLENKQVENRVSFSSFLLDLHPDTRNEFAESVSTLYKRQAVIKRMFPFICNGDIMYGCFIKQHDIGLITEDIRLKYMYANMLKIGNVKSWYMVLTYGENRKLEDVQYRELLIEDIEGRYNKEELLKLAETIFENRVQSILNNTHQKKIYPNDACPCGSGKKYKKCCGKNNRDKK